MRWIYLLVILALFAGCTKKMSDELAEESQSASSVFIVFESEIQGKVLSNSLHLPFGIAGDIFGNIYLTDAGNDRIIKFSKELKPLKEIGGYGTTEGSMNFPTYITIDNNLNVRYTDEKNRRVVHLNSDLTFVESILFEDEEEPLRFGFPSGIAVSDVGELWIADRDNNQIAVYNNVGNFSHILGDYGYAGGVVKLPEKIYRDPNDRFIVCDAGNKRLVLYDQYGGYQNQIQSKSFSYPVSVVMYHEHYFVLDGVTSEIFVLDIKGKHLTTISSLLPGDDTAMLKPSDIYVTADGKLLIADTGNDRLIVCSVFIEK